MLTHKCTCGKEHSNIQFFTVNNIKSIKAVCPACGDVFSKTERAAMISDSVNNLPLFAPKQKQLF